MQKNIVDRLVKRITATRWWSVINFRRLSDGDYVLDVLDSSTGKVYPIDEPEQWYRIEGEFTKTLNVILQVRMTCSEREDVRQAAAKNGQNISEYIRTLIQEKQDAARV